MNIQNISGTDIIPEGLIIESKNSNASPEYEEKNLEERENRESRKGTLIDTYA